MTALTEKSVASSGFFSVFGSSELSAAEGEPDPELVCSGDVVFDPDELESWLADDSDDSFWCEAMICPEMARSPAA